MCDEPRVWIAEKGANACLCVYLKVQVHAMLPEVQYWSRDLGLYFSRCDLLQSLTWGLEDPTVLSVSTVSTAFFRIRCEAKREG